MDKFIKCIEKIVSENFLTGDMSSLSAIEQGYKIGKSEVAQDLQSLLLSYYKRHESIDRFNELIEDAAFRWHSLPGDALHLNDLSSGQAYNLGFIAAVLQLMRILGIDESRVKK